jgi:membrane fusion protein (multidrug efflux system)
VGLPIQVTCDALPGITIEGSITAINPEVDRQTRNVQLQATIDNRDEKLRPGMFVNVTVDLPEQEKVLSIPVTSVLYAPHGNSVFVVDEGGEDKEGKVLRQQFVRLGRKQGDFTAAVDGLKPGEVIVTTGVFKLRNGQQVVIDNTLAPNFQQSPKPENN